MPNPIGDLTGPIGDLDTSVGVGGTWGAIYGNIENQTDLIGRLTLKLNADEKGAANGVATLDANGNVPLSQLPVTVITEVFVVDDEAEMLALTAQVGDVAVREDESKSYILQGNDPTVLSDWVELLSPTAAVTSVNGQVGTVILNADHIDDSATAHKFVTATQVGLINTSIQPDNVGLTNPREWTASTVPQSEAEAGTATTRRAWTAQRVFQAIAAWWNASSAKIKLDGIQTAAEVNQNAFSTLLVSGGSNIQADSKTATATFVAGTALQLTANSSTDTITFDVTTVPLTVGGTGANNAAGARTNLGLGTAATANVTTSTTDTTSGRVLTVGYGGLHVPTSVEDFSALSVGQSRNVLFRTPFQPEDRPTATNYHSGIVFGHNVAGFESMLVFGTNDGEDLGAAYIRNKTEGVWQPWRRVLDSRSLVTGNEDTTANHIPTVGWVQANANRVPYVQLSVTDEGVVTVVGSSTGITATVVNSTNINDLTMSFSFSAGSGLIKPVSSVTMFVEPVGSGDYHSYVSFLHHQIGSSGYTTAPGWTPGSFSMTGVTITDWRLTPFYPPIGGPRTAYLFFN